MADYNRFISYIYLYERGMKTINTGFAKVESRGPQCRIDITMKNMYHESHVKFSTYMFVRKKGALLGIYLGKLKTESSMGEFHGMTDAGNIERSGYNLEQIAGMIIRGDNGKIYGTGWDDEVLNVERFVPIDEYDEGTMTETDDKPLQDFEEVPPETVEGSPETVEGSPENVERFVPIDEYDEGTMTETDDKPLQDFEEVPPETVEGSPETVEGSPETIEGSPETIEGSPETVEGSPEIVEGLPETDASASNTEADLEASDLGNLKDQSLHAEEMCPETVEGSPEIVEGLPETDASASNTEADLEASDLGNLKDQSLHAEEMCGMAPVFFSKETCMSKEAPKAGMEPEDSDQYNPEKQAVVCEKRRSEQKGQDSMERLFERGLRMFPFEDGEISDCIRMEPQDIGSLPMKYWIFANNSFLLHGYYSYRHLILARMKDGKCILGIPGVNYSREQFMAGMFGFDYFKPVRAHMPESCEFGYWYTVLE